MARYLLLSERIVDTLDEAFCVDDVTHESTGTIEVSTIDKLWSSLRTYVDNRFQLGTAGPCNIMVAGSSGSGKSFALFGSSQDYGLLAMFGEHIFDPTGQLCALQISLSMYYTHCENIIDILDSGANYGFEGNLTDCGLFGSSVSPIQSHSVWSVIELNETLGLGLKTFSTLLANSIRFYSPVFLFVDITVITSSGQCLCYRFVELAANEESSIPPVCSHSIDRLSGISFQYHSVRTMEKVFVLDKRLRRKKKAKVKKGDKSADQIALETLCAESVVTFLLKDVLTRVYESVVLTCVPAQVSPWDDKKCTAVELLFLKANCADEVSNGKSSATSVVAGGSPTRSLSSSSIATPQLHKVVSVSNIPAGSPLALLRHNSQQYTSTRSLVSPGSITSDIIDHDGALVTTIGNELLEEISPVDSTIDVVIDRLKDDIMKCRARIEREIIREDELALDNYITERKLQDGAVGSLAQDQDELGPLLSPVSSMPPPLLASDSKKKSRKQMMLENEQRQVHQAATEKRLEAQRLRERESMRGPMEKLRRDIRVKERALLISGYSAIRDRDNTPSSPHPMVAAIVVYGRKVVSLWRRLQWLMTAQKLFLQSSSIPQEVSGSLNYQYKEAELRMEPEARDHIYLQHCKLFLGCKAAVERLSKYSKGLQLLEVHRSTGMSRPATVNVDLTKATHRMCGNQTLVDGSSCLVSPVERMKTFLTEYCGEWSLTNKLPDPPEDDHSTTEEQRIAKIKRNELYEGDNSSTMSQDKLKSSPLYERPVQCVPWISAEGDDDISLPYLIHVSANQMTQHFTKIPLVHGHTVVKGGPSVSASRQTLNYDVADMWQSLSSHIPTAESLNFKSWAMSDEELASNPTLFNFEILSVDRQRCIDKDEKAYEAGLASLASMRFIPAAYGSFEEWRPDDSMSFLSKPEESVDGSQTHRTHATTRTATTAADPLMMEELDLLFNPVRISGPHMEAAHCVFYCKGDVVVLRPQIIIIRGVTSHCKLFVNGVAVTEEVTLQHNDVIQMGSCRFVQLKIPRVMRLRCADIMNEATELAEKEQCDVNDKVATGIDDVGGDEHEMLSHSSILEMMSATNEVLLVQNQLSVWDQSMVQCFEQQLCSAIFACEKERRHALHLDICRQLTAVARTAEKNDAMKMSKFDPPPELVAAILSSFAPRDKSKLCMKVGMTNMAALFSHDMIRYVSIEFQLKLVILSGDEIAVSALPNPLGDIIKVNLTNCLVQDYPNKNSGEIVVLQSDAQGSWRAYEGCALCRNVSATSSGGSGTWGWRPGVLHERIGLIQQMHEAYTTVWCGCDPSWLDKLFPGNLDPFLDAQNDELIGVGFVYLDSLQYLVDIDDAIAIINFKGHSVGLIKLRVRVWIDEVEVMPAYISVDRETHLRQFLNRTCIVRFYFESLLNLSPKLCASTFVQFKFFYHNQPYRTARHSGLSENPIMNSFVQLEQRVTYEFIDFILTGSVEMEVYGKRVLPPVALATAASNEKSKKDLRASISSQPSSPIPKNGPTSPDKFSASIDNNNSNNNKPADVPCCRQYDPYGMPASVGESIEPIDKFNKILSRVATAAGDAIAEEQTEEEILNEQLKAMESECKQLKRQSVQISKLYDESQGAQEALKTSLAQAQSQASEALALEQARVAALEAKLAKATKTLQDVQAAAAAEKIKAQQVQTVPESKACTIS